MQYRYRGELPLRHVLKQILETHSIQGKQLEQGSIQEEQRDAQTKWKRPPLDGVRLEVLFSWQHQPATNE